MVKSKHIYLLRRRRERKTDYRKRKTILLSRSLFLSPRITSKNISVQISKATSIGDEVLASAHTRELYKLGWKGSGTCLPAAYLTGLIAGLKAKKLDIKYAIVYSGLRQYKSGSRISATLKGVTDSGLDIHAGKETFPTNDRIKGEHISKYAESLLNVDKEMYLRRFSKIIKTGLKPEEYPKHFEDIKNKILGQYGANKK